MAFPIVLNVLLIDVNILPTSPEAPVKEDILLDEDLVDLSSSAATILTVHADFGWPFLPQRKHSLSL